MDQAPKTHTEISVYSDGSATVATKPGGYGWVLVIDGIKHSEGSGSSPKASNNDMEMEASIQGLTAAYQYIQSLPLERPPVKVTLISDSELVLGWASGQYQFRQVNKLDKFKQLQMLMALMNVGTQWVAGHTGQEFNERCDKLANLARKSIDSQPIEILSKIGLKRRGVFVMWYRDRLKIIDLDSHLVEDYNESVHGKRASYFMLKEEKE